MKCPKCQNEMTQLFVSWICDTCNPPSDTVVAGPTQQISSYDRETIFHRVQGFIDTRIEKGHPFLIAGGAGLFMEGFTNKYGDVDVFVPYSNRINDDTIDRLVNPKGCFKAIGQTGNQAYKLKHRVLPQSTVHNIAAILEYEHNDKDWDKKMQLIFVNGVSDPLQVLNGFDWNFCQVGVDETQTKLSTSHFEEFQKSREAKLASSTLVPKAKLKEPKVWTRLFKHAIRQDIKIPGSIHGLRQHFPATPFKLSVKQRQMLAPRTKFRHGKYTKQMVMDKTIEHCWSEMKLMIDAAARYGDPLNVLPSRHNEITFVHNIITFWSNKFSNYFI